MNVEICITFLWWTNSNLKKNILQVIYLSLGYTFGNFKLDEGKVSIRVVTGLSDQLANDWFIRKIEMKKLETTTKIHNILEKFFSFEI